MLLTFIITASKVLKSVSYVKMREFSRHVPDANGSTAVIKPVKKKLGILITNWNANHIIKQQISSQQKGHTCMLPWHAIHFLKGLGMLTPNPWENR